ncbi:carbohydrate esterase family 5 protein [Aspergillus aculeatinus CBS 121060]|uniref:Cutinase n=2 Tax=Aspergillus TaxID=5052 RepID=A0A8G1RUC4_9EURO|nr:cutinase-domain-containing protein [Aspergillus aculeatinus CBS 121060]XP_040801676.1 cutinase-domain-containing protein [Aspergillus fijiensis CBS 313.89]RAH72528.1 cutinase-domain-containing protein [Aspergillus aculeatinus CBS 121060]RAK77666.1 cutinase-domain-containing protein [Aspergillus fijiensis CBS 313.89]
MKSFVTLSLLATALAAPTPTLHGRQFDLSSLLSGSSSGSSTSSGSSGLSALASLFPTSGSATGSTTGSSDTSGSASGSTTGTTTTSTDSSSGLSALSSLFPSSSATTSSSGSSDGLSGMISSVMGGSSTQNGVTSNTGCKELTFIFARGTTEMGNMGSVVGPEVASALQSLTGNKVTVQGVDYPADWAGNMNMGASGGPKMASLVKQALSQCPNTKVVLGGYSQGSMVVHNAASSLSAGQIQAAVLFGDPLKMTSVGKLDSSKVKEFCAVGDPVCENGVNVMAHLSYGSDAQTAAQFLVSAVGLS